MKKFHTGEVVTGMPAHFTKNLLPIFFSLDQGLTQTADFQGEHPNFSGHHGGFKDGRNIHVYTNINAFR